MKEVIIIGGGIAGLTAGILLQKNGITTAIYEKNAIAGGECTGWQRESYYIDNCMHWLTGTKKDTSLNNLWREVGALGDDIEIYNKPIFFSSELNGEKITYWRDKEKTRQELLKLSPEDSIEINKLIDYVKLAESTTVPTERPFDAMSLIDYMKLGMSMQDMVKVLKEYGDIDISGLANRFKNPLIRKSISEYMPGDYQAYAFLVSYATITSGNGDIPKGGSLNMTQRMAEKYKSLGGKLHTNSPVKEVIIAGKYAKGIMLQDNTILEADKVIVTCDLHYTFEQLIPEKFMPKSLKTQYEDKDKYPIHSGFQVAFAVDGIYPQITGTNFFDCEKIQVGKNYTDIMSINSYDYEPSFAPEGHSIIQTNIAQTEEDADYWITLNKEKEEYTKKKMETAQKIMNEITKHYTFLNNKIKILDIWTPATYTRYTNAYKGAYMSFTITKGAKNYRVPNKIKGLKNVFLGSQWQMGPGGLPTALAMGKFAAWHVLHTK